MAIELLTPFTKVEKTQADWHFRWKFQSCPQCSFGRGGSGPPTVRLGSGSAYARI